MGSGFLSGAVWGLIVSGLAVVTASLLAEQPPGREPPLPPQTSAPADVAGDTTDGVSPADVEDVAATPEIAPAPGVEAPDADVAATPLADTDPAEVPQTAEVTAALDAPEAPESGAFDAAGDEPVLPNPQSVAPQVPEPESDLLVSTDPAQPPAPAAEAAPFEEAEPEEVVIIDEAPAAEMAETEMAEAEVAETEVSDAEDLLEEMAALDPDDTLPAAAPETSDSMEAEAPEAESAPLINLQGDGNGGLQDAVPVLRLGETDAEAPDATDEAEIEIEVAEQGQAPLADGAGTGRALSDFGAPFEAADLPLMSVVLLDDGSLSDAPVAVAAVPFPVSVALDPTQPGAIDRMQAYRAAGIEVLARAKLPEGAQPADVAVTMEGSFAALPQTVALIDVGEGGLQSDQAVTAAAISALAQDGRGLVTVSRGLNTALREAESQSVPAATIYRDLDSEGQDARVIRRFLDQAAFRARQESGVVLLGRVRPDTLSALQLWGQANRATQVSVAPISAVLLAE